MSDPTENNARTARREECSINLELKLVPSMLEEVAPLIDAGFTAREAQQVFEMAKGMSIDEEKSLNFPIFIGGKRGLLTVRIFMDDIASPDIYLVAEPSLCARIRSVLYEFMSGI